MRVSLRRLTRSALLLLAGCLVQHPLLAGATASKTDDRPLYQSFRYQSFDAQRRVVADQALGRTNYLLRVPGVDLERPGNDRARSVFADSLSVDSLLSGTVATRTPIDRQRPTTLRTEDRASGQPDPQLLVEEWRTGIFGSGIGKSGFVTADIDDDGIVEIVAGGATFTFGSDNFWYVLEYQAASQSYEMVWVSDLSMSEVTRIAAHDSDGDGVWQIMIGLDNGEIVLVDGDTLAERDRIQTPAGRIAQILLADADNDGAAEVAIGGENGIYLYTPGSFAAQGSLPGATGDFEVGNVDADAVLEIVLADGRVLSYDGATTTTEWDYPGGEFGARVELADIDDDGMEEIVAAASWYWITTFDADVQSPKWQLNADLNIDALLMVDVTGDGVAELLYGDGQWGSIYCHDAETRALLWSIPNPEHGVTDIGVYDTDGDQTLEVFWGSGATSTGPDYLFVHDASSQTFEWQSRHVDGPFEAVDLGNADADGDIEIVFASKESESGYDDGIVHVVDGIEHLLEWASEPGSLGSTAWTGVHDVAVGDVDDDGKTEIVVATDRLYDGALYIFDGETHELEVSYLYDDGAPLFSLAIADVDGDNETEIVAGGGREHTGAPGVYVYVIDGKTGVVEWNSVNLDDYWSAVTRIEVAQVDTDAALEIVALNNALFLIDGQSHVQWQTTAREFRSMAIVDLTGNGRAEIVLGGEDGSIRALDGTTKQVLWSRSGVSQDPIVGIAADAPVGPPQFVFASAGTLRVFNLGMNRTLWQSRFLGESAGRWNGFALGEVDGDSGIELVVGSDNAVYQFQMQSLAVDGFESGDLSGWLSP